MARAPKGRKRERERERKRFHISNALLGFSHWIQSSMEITAEAGCPIRASISKFRASTLTRISSWTQASRSLGGWGNHGRPDLFCYCLGHAEYAANWAHEMNLLFQLVLQGPSGRAALAFCSGFIDVSQSTIHQDKIACRTHVSVLCWPWGVPCERPCPSRIRCGTNWNSTYCKLEQ